MITASTTKTVRKKTKKHSSTVNINVRNKPLSSLTDEALHSYFANLNGHKPCDLYDFVIREVEKPLFKNVLSYTNGNQSEAAEILGINRGTLRKKLKALKLNGK